MDKQEQYEKEINHLALLYNFWLDLIPWKIPVLQKYETEMRAKKPYIFSEKVRRVRSEKNFLDVLGWETTLLLQRAKSDLTAADDQAATLAELYEAKNIRADSFRGWGKRQALEPYKGHGDEGEDHLSITFDELKRRCEEREKRDSFVKECKSAGVEVAIWPGATIEKMVADKLNVWIDDNITYLEKMKVQPRRVGSVEVKQTAAIRALVYTIDKAAAGEAIPGKADMVRDINNNYPQFEKSASRIYKLISTREATVPMKPTKQDCQRIAGGDWRRIVVTLSNHPDKVKEYIENEIIKR